MDAIQDFKDIQLLSARAVITPLKAATDLSQRLQYNDRYCKKETSTLPVENSKGYKARRRSSIKNGSSKASVYSRRWNINLKF